MRRWGLALGAGWLFVLAACSSTKSDDGGGACTDCAEPPRAPTSGTLPDGGAPPAPTDLTIAVEPAQLVLRQGASVDVSVTVTRPVGFVEDLALQVTGAPPNTTITTGALPGDKTKASFRIALGAAAPQGSVVLDVKAVGATKSAATSLALSIVGAPGAVDTTFAQNGRGISAVDVVATGMGVQPDGKFIVGGYAGSSTHDLVAVRFDANGLPDAGFGAGNGKAVMDFGGDEYAEDVLVQHDGKIVLAGYTYTPTSYGMAFTRFDANGTVDLGFGGANTGRLVLGPAQYQIVYGLHQQADGKILGSGILYNTVDYDFTVVRLTTQGTLDTSFNSTGYSSIQMGSNDYCLGVTVDAQGRIIGTGERYNGVGYDLVTARFSAQGGVDTTFNAPTGWAVGVPGGSANGFAWSPIVQPDGKIVVGGSVPGTGGQDMGVLRYAADGQLDATFGTGGKVALDVGAQERVYRLALDAQGRIVYVGHASSGAALDASTKAVVGRLLPTGAPDTSFGNNGRVILDYTPGAELAIGVYVQTDGRIVVGGYSMDGGKNVPWVTRLWN